jgi:hypothetical protein
MANPTGTVYLTAAPNYVWTDGDVYEIVQTDQQEGAALNASFGGLGVDNQPHQILLNKIELIHNHQVTDEANITAIANFEALFTGLMGPNGYAKIPVADVSRGLIQYIVQWGGYYPPGGVTGDDGGKVAGAFPSYTVTWPIPFPNACYWAGATMNYTNGGVTVTPDLGVGIVSLGLTSGNFFVNLFNGNGVTAGFTWMAIGF